jgi:hypothetical protein
MRNRKPLATKVASASSNGVTKHTSPLAFREGRIKAYLTQLNMDVREYTTMASIRLEMRLINTGLITI